MMDRKLREAHKAQIKLLSEIKALLEAKMGKVKLLDVLEYVAFCNENAEEQLCLIRHIKKENFPMYA